MPDRPTHEQELDRFLNDLAAGRPAASYHLDPDIMETVRAVRAMATSPLPEPLGDHIGAALRAEIGKLEDSRRDNRASPAQNGRIADAAISGAETASAADAVPRQEDSHPWASLRLPSTHRHASARTDEAPELRPGPGTASPQLSFMPRLLAAAAVVIVVVAGLVALRFSSTERAATVLDAPGRPAVDELVDATVESTAEGWTSLSVERWVFQPGPASLTIPPLDGPQWIVAEAAGFEATIGGDRQELTPNQGLVIAAGREVVLKNAGSGEATVLRGVAAARFSLETYDRSAIQMEVALDTEGHEALPSGSSRIVFERLTLQAGTSLLLEPATGQDWVDVADGRLGLTLVGDALPGTWVSGREREFLADDPLPALVPGTRATLRSLGDEPLVLLRLRLMPHGESGS